jgi:hypothetical protein
MVAHAPLIRLLAMLLQDGWMPLHYAACNGHTKVVELLRGAGADIHTASKVRGNETDYTTAMRQQQAALVSESNDLVTIVSQLLLVLVANKDEHHTFISNSIARNSWVSGNSFSSVGVSTGSMVPMGAQLQDYQVLQVG